jgi:hypothetical protein
LAQLQVARCGSINGRAGGASRAGTIVGVARRGLLGSKRGMCVSTQRRLTCSASVPRVSARMIRALAWTSRMRSSLDSCCDGRTKMPPGRSSRLASLPEAIRPMIWSCSSCR